MDREDEIDDHRHIETSQTERTSTSRSPTLPSASRHQTNTQQSTPTTTNNVQALTGSHSDGRVMVSSSDAETQRTIRNSTMCASTGISMGSPPPYPGPPLHPTNVNNLPPRYDSSSLSRSYSNQNPSVLYALTQHGQIPVIPLQLPGQIQYDDMYSGHVYERLNDVHSFSPPQWPPNEVRRISHSIQPQPTVRVRSTSITAIENSNLHSGSYAPNATRVRSNVVQRELPNDFFGLTISCLFVCICLGNVVALLFIIPAIYCSTKAQQFNNQGSYNRAKRYSSASFICNILALFEYIITVTIVCGGVAIWYTGLLPTYFL